MGTHHTSVVTRDIPYMFAISADELNSSDIFRLERVHHVSRKDFVLVKHTRECIVLNKGLEDLKEIKETIEKVMRSKYLPEKLLDKFQVLTDKQSSYILQLYYSEWQEELQKRELNKQALSILKSAKSFCTRRKVERNRQIINELFDIGFGAKGAVCDWQQRAENAFMYGYLLGAQSQKGGTV